MLESKIKSWGPKALRFRLACSPLWGNRVFETSRDGGDLIHNLGRRTWVNLERYEKPM